MVRFLICSVLVSRITKKPLSFERFFRGAANPVEELRAKLWFSTGQAGIGLDSFLASREKRSGHRLAVASGDTTSLRRSLPDRNHAGGFFCPPTKNLQTSWSVSGSPEVESKAFTSGVNHEVKHQQSKNTSQC